MPNNTYKCTNCNKDYRNQRIEGKEPDLCTSCTLFYLEAREKTLNDVKHALNSNTYWKEIQAIETRRKQLK